MSNKVKGTLNSAMWEVEEGKECEVLDEFFYNGEGWYKLRDIKTGKIFESPDVFWKEMKNA